MKRDDYLFTFIGTVLVVTGWIVLIARLGSA